MSAGAERTLGLRFLAGMSEASRGDIEFLRDAVASDLEALAARVARLEARHLDPIPTPIECDTMNPPEAGPPQRESDLVERVAEAIFHVYAPTQKFAGSQHEDARRADARAALRVASESLLREPSEEEAATALVAYRRCPDGINPSMRADLGSDEWLAERDRLREALEPFAAAWAKWQRDHNFGDWPEAFLTGEDWIRAAEALKPAEPKGEFEMAADAREFVEHVYRPENLEPAEPCATCGMTPPGRLAACNPAVRHLLPSWEGHDGAHTCRWIECPACRGARP